MSRVLENNSSRKKMCYINMCCNTNISFIKFACVQRHYQHDYVEEYYQHHYYFEYDNKCCRMLTFLRLYACKAPQGPAVLYTKLILNAAAAFRISATYASSKVAAVVVATTKTPKK